MRVCPSCRTDNPARAKFCLECGRRLPDVTSEASEPRDAHESRRVVTVLFSDIVGSTALGEALDPETLRVVMTRYFATMEAVLDRHGGTVEKFIGDAIMAVFGLRAIHEDDALRAVRAALEMRDSLAELNAELEATRQVTIATRTGVHTGEVVAGDPTARQTLVTGDAVNTAARLEQAAAAGEILVGDTTWRLVRDRISGESVAPIGAKGKAEPVPAIRILSLRLETDRNESSADPLIGRGAELHTLQAALERVVADRRASLVNVVGPAGVGKSRLIEEFLAQASDRARILRGRCLPYGEGITYWPLREVLGMAAGIFDSDLPAEGVQKLVDLMGDAEDGSLVAARLASAIGLSPDPVRQEEVFWAVRRVLAALASRRPLIVVIEDIQWAEPTFLELVDQVVDHVEGVPLLILCPARPASADVTPGSGRSRSGAIIVLLDGLSDDAAAALLDSLPGGPSIPVGLRGRILASAQGNPLFVREMVGMLVEDGLLTSDEDTGASTIDADTVRIPPTIQALMAARIDGLPLDERSLAQRASVIGRTFDETAVVELTPPTGRSDVTRTLLALLRRELVAPERSDLTVADAYTFRHILIRDAAYEALRKTDRAELHARFADWLERAAGDRLMEFEEILGYHLREAYRYRVELREAGPLTEQLGSRAAGYLHAAARRARDRGDSAAAVRLYQGAETLPMRDLVELAALPLDHGLALLDVGRLAEARRVTDDALRLAVEVGDRRVAARSRLLRLDISRADGSLVSQDPAVDAELATALRDAEASGDPGALADAWGAKSGQSWLVGLGASEGELHIALGFARSAGDQRVVLDLELNLLVHTFAGPTPVGEVVEAARELSSRAGPYSTVRAEAEEVLAVSEAMSGRFEEAVRVAEHSLAILDELAQVAALVNGRTYLAWVHRLSGDLPAAEAVLRRGLAEAVAVGDRSLESFVSCRLAEVLVNQDRFDEAEAPLAVAERDPIRPTVSRIVGARARIRAHRGDAGAERDVKALLALVAEMPWPNVQTEAYIDAAWAMASLGARSVAERYAREALRLCEAKGNVALAATTSALVDRIADDRGGNGRER